MDIIVILAGIQQEADVDLGWTFGKKVDWSLQTEKWRVCRETA